MPLATGPLGDRGFVLCVERVTVSWSLCERAEGVACRASRAGAGNRCAVANALEAVTAVKSTNDDVVLKDVQMPAFDGLDATIQIGSEPLQKLPHIIAVTANATIEDREECLAAGMNSYMAKPYRLHALRRALLQFVHARNSALPPPAQLEKQ